MADRKGYNGLHLPGGLSREPTPEQVAQQIQQAFNRELQTLSRDLFVRAASGLILQGDTDALGVPLPCPEEYRELAENCQLAARSYFEGIGVLKIDEPPTEPASTPEA